MRILAIWRACGRARLSAAARLIGLVLCGVGLPALGDGLASSSEYIVGFIRYVHWIDEARVDSWRVCVVGGPLAEQERAYLNASARDKPIVLQRIGPNDSLAGCQVLDLTEIDAAAAKAMVVHARHLPVLTVGNGSAFCSEGGHICLDLKNSEQKFEVNLSALRESGLSASALLLTLGNERAASKDGQ